MWIRKDTTLEQECALKETVQNMYRVHGRVNIDDMYEFQHSSSHAHYDCTFRSKIRDPNAEVPCKKARLATDSCL